MSQNDFNIANQGFPSFRSDLNSALQALASNSSGSTEPATTYANQFWYDDANNLLKMRDEANANWITLGTLDQVAKTFSVPALTGVTASAAELNVVDGANTTLAPAILANPKNYIDPENRIINGAFDFWQRGTSFTASGYGADRWSNNLSGGTVTMSRQAFTLGDTLGSNNPTYFLRQTVSGQSASSHVARFQQPIEDVRSYAGQTITVLGWARRSSGSGNMAVEVAQDFGSGGSPSSYAPGTGQTVTLTSSWAAFAVTFAVPSISGKTLGTNNNSNTALLFYTSAGSDYNARTNSLGIQTIGVDLWGVHIKVGTHTTAATDLYKQPELGPELARCQRYYYASESTAGLLFDVYLSAGGHQLVSASVDVLPVTMRATPAISVPAGTYSNVTSGAWATRGQRILNTGNATAAGRCFYSLSAAGSITADAEL
jgi:hypothetical protein